jgi:hypothetical protein
MEEQKSRIAGPAGTALRYQGDRSAIPHQVEEVEEGRLHSAVQRAPRLAKQLKNATDSIPVLPKGWATIVHERAIASFCRFQAGNATAKSASHRLLRGGRCNSGRRMTASRVW